MKRFIHSSTPQSPLSQLIKRIDYFNIVDDCSQCNSKVEDTQLEIELPLDHDVKLDLLNLFKKCNSVIIERRQNNLDFITEHDLTIRDILAIMHNLKEDDFNDDTHIITRRSTVITLNPRIQLPYERNAIEIDLCIRLDIDENRRSAAAFISID